MRNLLQFPRDFQSQERSFPKTQLCMTAPREGLGQLILGCRLTPARGYNGDNWERNSCFFQEPWKGKSGIGGADLFNLNSETGTPMFKSKFRVWGKVGS